MAAIVLDQVNRSFYAKSKGIWQQCHWIMPQCNIWITCPLTISSFLKPTLNSLHNTRSGMQTTWLFILYHQGFTMSITTIASNYIEIQFMCFLLLHFEMILKFLRSGDHWPNCTTLQAWKEELPKSAPKLHRVLRSTVWLPHHLAPKRCVSSSRLYQTTHLLRYPAAATLWNALPNNIKTSARLATFKARLKTHLFWLFSRLSLMFVYFYR